MKKFALGIIAAVLVICCILSIIGVVVYQQVIRPNTDWEQTTTINGQTVTQQHLTPGSISNILIVSTNENVEIINKLNRLGSDNTPAEFKSALAELDSLTKSYVEQFEGYKTTLVNYADYSAQIEATSKYHLEMTAATKKFFNDKNISIIIAGEATSKADYDTYQTTINEYNNAVDRIEAEFNAAMDTLAS